MDITLQILSGNVQDAMLDILTSKAVAQTYMLPDFEKREDAIPLFQRLMTLSQGETKYVRGIYLEDSLIGYTNEVEIADGAIELGYVIHPDHWGKGYMTRALRIAISELFRMGYEEVVCGAFLQNHASIRVMEKAGMTKIDKIDLIEYRGKTHTCVYYSIQK